MRDAKAAATRQRIVDAARDLFVDTDHDFTLDRVAASAGVSVQTVIRAFGNKERLINETIGSLRNPEPRTVVRPIDSVAEAVAQLYVEYDQIGDRVIRMLAEEHRIPGFAEVAQGGRDNHRAWVEAVFADRIAPLRGRRRTTTVLALVAATDVYLWKLLRRDLGLDHRRAEATIVRLVEGALDPSTDERRT